MNKSKLAKEGEKWVQDGLISEKQLQAILSKYQLKDHRYLLVLFATLFISIGVLIYAWSDWSQVSNLIRISLMIVSMVVLYFLGEYFYKEESDEFAVYPQIVSISFLMLGYLFFGATILLCIHLYDVTLLSAWPYIIWAVAGIVLYRLYPHQLIYFIAIGVTLFGQIYSSYALSTFSVAILIIYIVGYGFIAYKRNHMMISSMVAGGFVIHSLVATQYVTNEYYWFLLFMFILYSISQTIPKRTIRLAFFYTAIFTTFIYKIVETFILQEEQFFSDITYEWSFFIVMSLIMIGMTVYLIVSKNMMKLIDVSLFIPLFFLPYGYIFVILSMFIYSLFYLINGFLQQVQAHIRIGIITFVLSTFTAYVQYAWESLNKSLFFIIGGLLLFTISFVLERIRRKQEQGESS